MQAEQKIKVLVVDNSRESGRTFAYIFNQADNINLVGIVYSHETALDLIQENQPHIVILDTQLQSSSGLAFAQTLLKSYPQLGVIIMSESADPQLLRQAMAAGAREFLQKPVEEQTLLDKITQVFAYVSVPKPYISLEASSPPPSDESDTPKRVTLDDIAALSDVSPSTATNKSLPVAEKKRSKIREDPNMQAQELRREVSAPAEDSNNDGMIMFGDVEEATSTKPAPAPEPETSIQFTAYAPREVARQHRYSLITYAHIPTALNAINQDVQKFRDEFGDLNPRQRTAKGIFQVATGTAITIVPECDGIDFSPNTLTKTWQGDWVRFNFDFVVPETYDDDDLWIRLSIRIKGLEIAHIKASCEVVETPTDTTTTTIDENPLAAAAQRGDMTQVIAKPYRNVFISYSRRDSALALKRAEEIEKALGDKVFLDVKSLRAGDDWQYKLAEAIKNADIFHLLWSESSAASEYCRYEWDYALNHKCGENRCVGVIRPVYWENPMPTPPPELGHLHFEYIDLDTPSPEND